MQSPEYVGEQLTDDMRTVNVEASKSSARAASLLRLNGLGSRSRANGLRLKNGDVIVAVVVAMYIVRSFLLFLCGSRHLLVGLILLHL